MIDSTKKLSIDAILDMLRDHDDTKVDYQGLKMERRKDDGTSNK